MVQLVHLALTSVAEDDCVHHFILPQLICVTLWPYLPGRFALSLSVQMIWPHFLVVGSSP